ncbi:MAG TPA: hypothetical protein VIL26_00005, partial [Clostridia bacterium]
DFFNKHIYITLIIINNPKNDKLSNIIDNTASRCLFRTICFTAKKVPTTIVTISKVKNNE